jgi:SAM-dependent methyltransferase
MDLRETPRGVFRRHPWEVSRCRFFRRILRDAGSDSNVRRVLDVGAGDSWFSIELRRTMPAGVEIVCWDTGYEGSHAMALPEPSRALSFTRSQPETRFDLLLFLDVVEHVEDDLPFLSRILQTCAAPRARVLLSVPAWPCLMSGRDEALGHFRRYRPEEGRRLLASAGLTILREGGLFHSLVLPRLLDVAGERVFGRCRSEAPAAFEWRAGEFLGRLAESALAVDNGVARLASARRWQIPGLSWWALCRMS